MEDSFTVTEFDIHQAGALEGIREQNGTELRIKEENAMEGVLRSQDQAHMFTTPNDLNVGPDVQSRV